MLIMFDRPEPDITWMKAEGEIAPDRKELSQYDSSLMIKKLKPSDSGTYVCKGNIPTVSASQFASQKFILSVQSM